MSLFQEQPATGTHNPQAPQGASSSIPREKVGYRPWLAAFCLVVGFSLALASSGCILAALRLGNADQMEAFMVYGSFGGFGLATAVFGVHFCRECAMLNKHNLDIRLAEKLQHPGR